MKTFTLTFLLSIILHFSGFCQEKFPIPVKADVSVKIVKFYPNPATTNITFEFIKGAEKNYDLQIYNSLGKKVLEIKNPSITNPVNLNDFNRGVYIFQLRDNSGKIVEAGKFQVSK